MGVTSLLIEGGGDVNGRALREGIADKGIFYIDPLFLSGDDAKSVATGTAIASLADAVRLHDMNVSKRGDDLRIEGYFRKR